MRCEFCDQKLEVGEFVDIRYDPDDPVDNLEQAGRPRTWENSRLAWWSVAVIGALAGGCALWLVLRRAWRLHR